MSGSPLRIAVVRKDYDPLRGGAERYARALVAALIAQNHDVHVFSRALGREVAGLPGDPVVYHPVISPSGPTTTRKNFGFARAVTEALRGWRFDHVIGLSPFWPQRVCRLGDGVTRHWASLDARSPSRALLWRLAPRHRGMLALERAMLQPPQVRRIVVNSELCLGHLRAWYPEAAERARLVPNGVDARYFAPDEKRRHRLRAEFGISADERVVLFVGNNLRRKGFFELLRALAALPRPLRARTRLWVLGAGKGGPGVALSAAWRRLSSPVRLASLGVVEDARPFYLGADLFCLPTWYDPMSNATLEAMACALAVVTTRQNGAAELIAHEREGLLVDDARDLGALSAHLRVLLEDDARSGAMGDAARQAVLPLSWAQHARRMLEVCREAGNG